MNAAAGLGALTLLWAGHPQTAAQGMLKLWETSLMALGGVTEDVTFLPKASPSRNCQPFPVEPPWAV